MEGKGEGKKERKGGGEKKGTWRKFDPPPPKYDVRPNIHTPFHKASLIKNDHSFR